MKNKKIYIKWERLPVYEDLPITRCFKCQEFHHKISKCENQTICPKCTGNHTEDQCNNHEYKCNNCEMANCKYKTNHNTSHKASDPECPTRLYHLRNTKIDYGLNN